MNEEELLYQAGLSSNWVDLFVRESNLIDPQPGDSEPGSLVYDGHREAVIYAVLTASQGRYALPNEVHTLLLRDHKMARRLRYREIKLGLNYTLPPVKVPHLFWEWNRLVKKTVDRLRKKKEEGALYEIWNLHAIFENIRPYEIYNGKTGRVLMLNHALLVDLDPWIVPFDAREVYLDFLRYHPTSDWGMNPPE